jgi:hypothetical protein
MSKYGREILNWKESQAKATKIQANEHLSESNICKKYQKFWETA